MRDIPLSRRSFLAGTAACAGASLLGSGRLLSAVGGANNGRYPICVFVKYLQSLSFDELAETVSGLGFDGIEATVRPKGQILPEHAEEELPRLVDALKKRNLDIMIMTSGISRADDPLTPKVLRTAAALGIKKYRMDYYRYDLNKPVAKQLEALKPVVKDLAALNRELGIQAVYQNHAGAPYVGASIWDIHELLEDIPKEEIGIAFDIRHATVEGGKAWPVSWNLVQPHLGAVYIKDAKWDGRTLIDGPLGDEKGVVDPAFFQLLKKSDFPGPISLHVEYLDDGTVPEQVAAIRRDFATLKGLLNQKT